MPIDLPDIQQKLRNARQARDAARAELRSAALAVGEAEARLAEARRRAVSGQPAPEVAELERALKAGQARQAAGRAALADAIASARATAERLLPSPAAAIEAMSDDIPFVLFPLRIETKFALTASAPALLVRVFPDDVLIAQHERALTANEAADGQSFWRARARANAETNPIVRDNAHRSAWSTLVNRHGGYRASWVARATRPQNWVDTIQDPDALIFPTVETQPMGWTSAPRAFALPDRLVVRLVAGGVTRDVPGAPIPDDLALGPEPLGAEAAFDRDPATGRLVVSDDLRWLVDFEEAVRVGMGLRIPLDLPRERQGFDRVFVLGVRASSDPSGGRDLLLRLFESHRFSNGLELLRQGTPTNNTEEAPSGHSSAAADWEAALADEDRPPPAAEPDELKMTDAERLARALGLPLEAMSVFAHAAELRDVAEAIAMNRALWPGTLGHFLRTLLARLVSRDEIAFVERWATNLVVGRGLLPAVRVGAQPYGVLVTSTLAGWQWSAAEVGRDRAHHDKLLALVRRAHDTWQQLATLVPRAGHGDERFQTLLSVIGLQASSVAFFARKGIADDYLDNFFRYAGTGPRYATELWEAARARKAAALTRLGLPLDREYPLRWITFYGESSPLTGPVIDDDPRLPLSETEGIRPFDGTTNYIDWLLTSDRTTVQSERFARGDGTLAPVPRALLYQLLRYAYLDEIAEGSREVLRAHANQVFRALDEPDRAILYVGADKAVSSQDYPTVDAGRIGVTGQSMALGDALLASAAGVPGAPTLAEALPLARFLDALAALRGLPTARLERVFAEHVDTCSHRLDAWIQSLFAYRLRAMRSTVETSGVHLGAYGWVEDVRPAVGGRRPVDASEVPEVLRDDAAGLVAQMGNGGYVLAPSLSQAVTAAVLRNAYLSHADPDSPDLMAVNLSSSRVRVAMSYIEGLRNGQELAALLGYQLERGLHEGHPEVELDAFVYVLRDRFPLISRKLTPVPDGTAAEVVEARNVINGYDLLDFIRGKPYGYGIASLPAPGTAEARAIEAEIGRLADSLDALADVLLGESVHQVVQGNYDRAKGTLQAVTEGEAPPELDLVQTPRSGRGLAHRVAVILDPASTTGWRAPLTARAAGNAALNAWLASQLPSPGDVQFAVTVGAGASTFMSLADLPVEPLDIVLTCGERIGDFSSELERLVVEVARAAHGVADDVRTFLFARDDPTHPIERSIVIDTRTAQSGKRALASLQPWLGALRRLVAQSRPVHARDLMLPTEAHRADPANPRGFDEAELKARAEAAHQALATAHASLASFMATKPPTVDPSWSTELPKLRQRLLDIVANGVSEALPGAGRDVTGANIEALVALADSILKRVGDRLALARTQLDITFTDPLPTDPAERARELGRRVEARVTSYTDAMKALSGPSYVLVSAFRMVAELRPELAAAATAPVETDPLVVSEWVQSLVRVRGAMAALDRAATFARWFGTGPLRLTPVQLPARPGDRWIGARYGSDLAPGDVVSIALSRVPSSFDGLLTGLLVDEWTELVPPTQETIGLTFHFNRPNAVAPQAMLVAVPPRRLGTWRWNDLMDILRDTLDRARLRAVEPDHVLASDYAPLLPAVVSEFAAHLINSNLFVANAAAVARPTDG